jgi:hypothetical protein
MKRFLLIVLFSLASCFFIEKISCTFTKEQQEKIKKHAEDFPKFIKKSVLREREVFLLAHECHDKQCLCSELEDAKGILIDETMKRYNDFGPELYIVPYIEASMNRKELYYDDEDILSRYKEKLPQNIYESLEALEQHVKDERARTIIGDGIMKIDSGISTILSLEIMDDLKKSNPEGYKACINYFAESTASRRANTKTIAIDSNEQAIAYWRKGFDQRTKEEQEEIEEYLSYVKDHRLDWETNSLNLDAVHKELENNK